MLRCFSFCYIWYFILWLTVYVLVHFYSSKQRKWKMNQCTSEDQWNKQGIMFQCFYLKHKIFNNCLLSLWCLIRKIIGVDIHYEHCNNKRIFYWSTGVMFQYLIVNKTFNQWHFLLWNSVNYCSWYFSWTWPSQDPSNSLRVKRPRLIVRNKIIIIIPNRIKFTIQFEFHFTFDSL